LELCPGADAATELIGIRAIDSAGPEHLSFVSNRRYVRFLANTKAGAVLLDADTKARGVTAIRVADPYAAFARALAWYHPQAPVVPGVHASAVVDATATVEGAEIRALATVGPGASVGRGTIVFAGAHIGSQAQVGEDCRVMSTAVVCDGCFVGDRVVLNPGAIVGGEGFGFAPTPDGHVKIPQVGRAVVEDDVELGSNSCVDRAAMADTVVRRGAKLDNLVQVGHAAQVGPHSLMVAFSGVAGSSKMGAFNVLAARGTVLGHIETGDGVHVGACAVVTRDTPAGAAVSGFPAFEHGQWRRAALAFGELPAIVKRLRSLEARLATLEEGR
jgi:UDP-3-O-[3-hydroxymyristoyl] glucosamine N-acyltransferase